MRVVWPTPAKRDRAHAIYRIPEDYQAARARLYGRLVIAATRLGMFPESGRLGQNPDTRELVVPDTGYLLVYRIHARRVEILSVQPTARP
jgi:toxin ParE1/3/4